MYTYRKPPPNLSIPEQIHFLEQEIDYLQRIRESQRLPSKTICYKCKKDITGIPHGTCVPVHTAQPAQIISVKHSGIPQLQIREVQTPSQAPERPKRPKRS
jgi:hypothetical protein